MVKNIDVLDPVDKSFIDRESKLKIPALSPDIPEAGGDESGIPIEYRSFSIPHKNYSDIKMKLRVPKGTTDEELASYAEGEAAKIADKREKNPGILGGASDFVTDLVVEKSGLGELAQKIGPQIDILRRQKYFDFVKSLPPGVQIPAFIIPFAKAYSQTLDDPRVVGKYGVTWRTSPVQWEFAKIFKDTGEKFLTSVSGTKMTEEVLEFMPKGKETMDQYMARMEKYGNGWPKFFVETALELGVLGGAGLIGKKIGGKIARKMLDGARAIRRLEGASIMLAGAGTAYHLDRSLGKIGVRESNTMTQILAPFFEVAFPLGAAAFKGVSKSLIETGIGQQAKEVIATKPAFDYIRRIREGVTEKLTRNLNKKAPTPASETFAKLKALPDVDILVTNKTFANTRESLKILKQSPMFSIGKQYDEVKAVVAAIKQLELALAGQRKIIGRTKDKVVPIQGAGKITAEGVVGATKVIKGGKPVYESSSIKVDEIHALARILKDQVKKAQARITSGGASSFKTMEQREWISTLTKDMDKIELFARPGSKGNAKLANQYLKEGTRLFNQQRSLQEWHEIVERNIVQQTKAGTGKAGIVNIKLDKIIRELKNKARQSIDNPDYDPMFMKGLEDIDLSIFGGRQKIGAIVEEGKRTGKGLLGMGTTSKRARLNRMKQFEGDVPKKEGGLREKAEELSIPQGKRNFYENTLEILEHANDFLVLKTGKGELVIAGKLSQTGAWLTGLALGGAFGFSAGQRLGMSIGAMIGARFPVWLGKKAATPRGRKFIGWLIANPPQNLSKNVARGGATGMAIAREPGSPSYDEFGKIEQLMPSTTEKTEQELRISEKFGGTGRSTPARGELGREYREILKKGQMKKTPSGDPEWLKKEEEEFNRLYPQ